MDIVTRKKLNILIQLALSDNDFADSEREMINQVARERNFPQDALNELIANPEPIGSLGALSEKQKLDYLISSIELVLADSKVKESEIRMSEHIAIKLGFFKTVVSHLLSNRGKRPLRDLQLGDFRQV